MKQDKRLTVNPMSYKGLHDYPASKMAHGKDCTCYACRMARETLNNLPSENLNKRKRLTGYRMVSAFFHP